MHLDRMIPFLFPAPSASLPTPRLMRVCLMMARMHLFAESDMTYVKMHVNNARVCCVMCKMCQMCKMI
jgi:hypothetical protein